MLSLALRPLYVYRECSAVIIPPSPSSRWTRKHMREGRAREMADYTRSFKENGSGGGRLSGSGGGGPGWLGDGIIT